MSQVSEAVFSLRLQLFIRQIARVLFNVTASEAVFSPTLVIILSVRSRESCSTSQVSEAVFSRRLQLFISQIRDTTARGCSVVSLVRSRGSCSFPVFSLRLQLFVRHIARLLFNVTSIRGQCPGSLFAEVSCLSR